MLNKVLKEYGLQRRRMPLIKGKGGVITSYITYILIPRLAYTRSEAYLMILMAPLVVQHVTLICTTGGAPIGPLLGKGLKKVFTSENEIFEISPFQQRNTRPEGQLDCQKSVALPSAT